MPLHSITDLPGGVQLGLWQLTETPAALWPELLGAAAYVPLLPAHPDGPRQAQWLAARVLTQRLLAAAGQDAPLPHLHNDEAGRPWLTAHPDERTGLPAPAVSLSHSGAWVAALLGPPGTALGLDVELVRDKAERLAAKFLNAQELLDLTQVGWPALPDAAPGTNARAELLTLLWSAKETLFKLAGRRGVLFREHLLLDLPAGSWPVPGALPARLLGGAGCNSRHQIWYLRPAVGYVLTYCVAPPSA